jgi:hypothetical protein
MQSGTTGEILAAVKREAVMLRMARNSQRSGR